MSRPSEVGKYRNMEKSLLLNYLSTSILFKCKLIIINHTSIDQGIFGLSPFHLSSLSK